MTSGKGELSESERTFINAFMGLIGQWAKTITEGEINDIMGIDEEGVEFLKKLGEMKRRLG